MRPLVQLRAARSFEPVLAAPDVAGMSAFAHRILAERNLYGALAFAETAESFAVIQHALAVGPNDRVAGVTSSGDVLLSLAARGATVRGFDLNPAQTALAELKKVALQYLELPAFLSFMGVTEAPATERVAAFQRLSRALSPQSRSLLIQKQEWIGPGILNRGMTHLIIRSLSRVMASLVEPEVHALFRGERGTALERAQALDQLIRRRRVRWALLPALARWQQPLKWLFFPHQLCRVSARPEQMIASFFETFRPLLERGARDNPVLCRSVTGAVHQEWLTHLYHPDHWRTLRARELQLTTTDYVAGLSRLPAGWVTRFYLSNMPDYLSSAQLDALVAQMRRTAAPGARAVYFSLAADRLAHLGQETSDIEASRRLDKVHLYPYIGARWVERPAC